MVRKSFDELGLVLRALEALCHHKSHPSPSNRENAGRCKRKTQDAYLLRAPIALADIFAALQHGQDALNGGLFFLQFLHLQRLATSCGKLLQSLEIFLDKLDILDSQLFADNTQVAYRVYISFNMDNLGIVEAPHNLKDGIDGTDVRQESVAKSGSGGSPTR